MPSVSDEPALSFWLHYASREGALVEEDRDHALLLLPESLQDASELPEEVLVTSDPDIAREDGAVLLIAGHPAIDRAASAVLAEGDTGQAYLPWPGSRPPGRSALEARARELVPVEHGRIDSAGEPIATYVPLLRVGAMISYAASLTLRFQEQEEAWIDACTGIAVSERLIAALQGRQLLPQPDGHRRTLPPDFSLALAPAHEQLERRATARQASLAVHARRALESELMRADAYYQEALESIDRRRTTAAADRVPLLDAQAEATRAERARRRREIEDEFRSRHEIRPFRLHLVHVPAYTLPINVRRGSRIFSFALIWLAAIDEFAAVRCPDCGAHERLVANRDRLGCESCTPSATVDAQAPSTAGPPDEATLPAGLDDPHPRSHSATPPCPSGPADSTPARPAKRSAVRSVDHGARRSLDRSARRSVDRSAGRSVDRSAGRSVDHSARERTGNKLALSFWRGLSAGDRWPRSKAARDSPLRALYRLYGEAGPLCALGIPGHQWPAEMTASTYSTQPGFPELTLGSVIAGDISYRYSLTWWFEAGKPVVGEIMPSPHPLALPPARGTSAEVGARLRESAPAPCIELDRVAAALWRSEIGRSGLPFAVRCLATWWRVQNQANLAESPEAVAAAVACAVARAAGQRRGRAASAPAYDTDPALVERATQALKDSLRLDPTRGW